MSGGERPLPRGLRAAAERARGGPPRRSFTPAAQGGSGQMRDLGADWMVRFARTHPICERCYDARYPDRPPVRVKPEFGKIEQCCDCGLFTEDGIVMRADPRYLQYPRLRSLDWEA